MKALKKLGISLVVTCMMFFCMAFVSVAAEGTLQFTDPTTTNGAEVTVDATMSGGGAAIGDGDVTLTYDPAILEFVSGTNATGGNGTVTLSASGTGTETELTYSMVFKALTEGTATLEVSDYTAYLYSDESLNLTAGNSTITIGAAEAAPATETTTATTGSGSNVVTIGGTEYTIYEDFTDSVLPIGFTKTVVSYDGADRQCAKQDSGELYLFFLNDANGDAHMALYDSETQEFCFTEQIDLSEELYILLTNRGDGSNLPAEFEETTMTVNGNEFPVWQDVSAKDFFVMYALSSTGEESFYRYDQVEGTYQRYKIPEEIKDENALTGVLGDVQDFVHDNLIFILAGAALLLILFLILLITLTVKLRHRNRELDDLYDGDYVDEPVDDDEYDDGEYYEEDDDEVDDNEYYDEDDEYYDEEDDEYYDDDEEYYDDEEYDDYEDETSSRKSKSDDYSIDFIDI